MDSLLSEVKRLAMGKLINLKGKKFGRLTVIKRAENNKWGYTRWLCKCDCGNEKVVDGNSLRNGHTKSCGCLRKDLIRGSNKERSLPLGLANMRIIMSLYKWQAKKRGHKWELTEEQFKNITQKNCFYCGAPPSNISRRNKTNGNYTYNGLDRVDNTKGYTIDNVVPCCFICNQAKHKLTIQEFKDWIERIYHKTFDGGKS